MRRHDQVGDRFMAADPDPGEALATGGALRPVSDRRGSLQNTTGRRAELFRDAYALCPWLTGRTRILFRVAA
jgi:hypothetical protein